MATEQVIKTVFKFKRGTAEAWHRINPILEAGEPGYITDTNQLKVGDGVTRWNDLKFMGSASGEAAILNANTKEEFPEVGEVSVIYKAQLEKKLYQWNPDTASYESLMGSDIEDDGILILYGGSAFDNVEV